MHISTSLNETFSYLRCPLTGVVLYLLLKQHTCAFAFILARMYDWPPLAKSSRLNVCSCIYLLGTAQWISKKTMKGQNSKRSNQIIIYFRILEIFRFNTRTLFLYLWKKKKKKRIRTHNNKLFLIHFHSKRNLQRWSIFQMNNGRVESLPSSPKYWREDPTPSID